MDVLVGRETEHNWSAREKLCKMLLQDIEGQLPEEQKNKQLVLLQQIKPYYFDLLDVCYSVRTQLALTAIKVVGALACLTNEYLDSFLDASLVTLIRLCSAAKKLIANAAGEALLKVFYLTPSSRILGHLSGALNDKNVHLRQRMVRVWLLTLEKAPGKFQKRLWSELEPLMLRALGDASAAVRSDTIRILHLMEERDGFSTEIRAMLGSKLDHTTAKQVRQALASTKLVLPERPGILPQETVDGDANNCADSDTDGEIILPMQSIRLNHETRACTTKDLPESEETVCQQLVSDLTPSRIPVRKPTLPCVGRKELHLCTPLRNRIVAFEIPSTPTTDIAMAHVLSELLEEPGIRSTSLWKRLSALDSNSLEALPATLIGRLIISIHEHKKALENADLVGLVGMTIRRLFSVLDHLLEFTEDLIRVLLWLSHHHRSGIRVGIDEIRHPCTWLKWDEGRLEVLIKFITSDSMMAQDTLSMLITLVESGSLDGFLSSLLRPLHQMWAESALQASSEKSRLIVKCLTCARLRTGEILFFQALPALTISQRNLLNAYLTMSPTFRK